MNGKVQIKTATFVLSLPAQEIRLTSSKEEYEQFIADGCMHLNAPDMEALTGLSVWIAYVPVKDQDERVRPNPPAIPD